MNGGDKNKIDHDDKWETINKHLKHLESFTLVDCSPPSSSPSGTNKEISSTPFLQSSSNVIKNYRRSEGDLPRKENSDFVQLVNTTLPPQSAPVINSTHDCYWLNSPGANMLETLNISEASQDMKTNNLYRDSHLNNTINDNHLSVLSLHNKATVHERSKSDSASTSAITSIYSQNQLVPSLKNNVSSLTNSPTLGLHNNQPANMISSPSSPSLSHSPYAVSQNSVEIELCPDSKYNLNNKMGKSMILRNPSGTYPRKFNSEYKNMQLSPINRRKSAPLSDAVQIKSIPRRAFSQTKFTSSNSPRGTPPPPESFPGLMSKEDSLQKVNEIFSSPELVHMLEDEEPRDEEYTRGRYLHFKHNSLTINNLFEELIAF